MQANNTLEKKINIRILETDSRINVLEIILENNKTPNCESKVNRLPEEIKKRGIVENGTWMRKEALNEATDISTFRHLIENQQTTY